MSNRIALLAYVNPDKKPMAFFTEKTAVDYIRNMLENRIQHYNPVVAHAPASIQTENPTKRMVIVIYLDLDEMLGANTRTAARHCIRDILRDVLFAYNPVVSFAPADMQPAKVEEGIN